MVKVRYNYRILADKFFFSSSICTKQVLGHLMFIKATSEEHPQRHNVILKRDSAQGESCCSAVDFIYGLKACFKEEDIPHFLEEEKDVISLYSRFAINLTAEAPYTPVVILTGDNQTKEYAGNNHLTGLSTIHVKEGKDAQEFIKKYFQQYMYHKELGRIGLPHE